jgi:outer membrane protein OmpA-like peptidoglycan-associated protein
VTRLILLATLAIAFATGARAQPAFTADQFLTWFGEVEKTEKPRTRSLCIGAEDQCPAAPSAQPSASAFDLVLSFDYNSADLTPAAKTTLDELAKAMRSERTARARFMIEGHTDATGTEKYNLGLSVRRADAVVAYLEQHGIEASRLDAKGFGETRPRTANPADPANRRVETRVLFK